MKGDITQLIESNKAWAEEITSRDPMFFDQFSSHQSPQFLWIGCSDSRVPPNQIAGALPGEIFTHKNVGNLVQLNYVSAYYLMLGYQMNLLILALLNILNIILELYYMFL